MKNRAGDLHSTDVCYLEKCPAKIATCLTLMKTLNTEVPPTYEGKKTLPTHFARDDSAITRCDVSAPSRGTMTMQTDFCCFTSPCAPAHRGEMFSYCQLHRLRNGSICIISSLSGNQLVVCGCELTSCHLISFWFLTLYTK